MGKGPAFRLVATYEETKVELAVEAIGLGRTFEGRSAVEGLDLRLEEGACLALLGPNGAGKTTTVRLLAGLIAPTSGRARVLGLDVEWAGPALRARIGLLPETPGLYDRLSGLDNLLFFARLQQVPRPLLRIEEALRRFGLWEHREAPTAIYSKGMKQKLALARALLHDPELLFLDEPTAGLDPTAAHQVRELLADLGSRGRTLLVTTHNLDEAERLADHVALLDQRLITVDTPDRLRRRLFGERLVVELACGGESLAELVRGLPFVSSVETTDRRLAITVEDVHRNAPDLVTALVDAGARIVSVAPERPPLEAVYRRLLAEAGLGRETP